MKKILTAFLTVTMLFAIMQGCCFAAAIAIKTKPSVFLCGSFYNIVWSTTENGTGYVDYTYQGQPYRVYDEEAGIVRTDDYIHTVSVPVEHLNSAGAYTVTSVAVSSRSAYSVSYGTSCSTSRNFVSYHGQEEINIWTLSDLHRTSTSDIMTYVNRATSYLQGGSPDIVFLNGDIANNLPDKTAAEIAIFDTAAQLTGGEIPTLFSRGNHETRRDYAPDLLQYLPSDTGEFYFNCQYGPISFVVLDFGEDKVDTHVEYNGLVDYNNYRAQQTEWLENEAAFLGNPTYRIAVCHGPNIKNHFGYNWLKPLSALGADILSAGHYHTVSMWRPSYYNSDKCEDFPIAIDGSHLDSEGFNASQLLLKNGEISSYAVSDTGSVISDYQFTFVAGRNIKSSSASTSIEAVPPVPTAYGKTVSSATKGAAPDFGFTTKPCVFDTGDTYTVTWATTPGVNANGEVYLEYEGQPCRFTDNESGALVTKTNIHAVRIPKRYLENNTYKIVSQNIISYSSSDKGDKVEIGNIPFYGYDGGKVTMLEVSDLNGNSDMVGRIRALGDNYDVLIMNGDILRTVESGQDAVEGIIKNGGALTNGSKPIIFARGEAETMGAYAPYLNKIVRNSTRQFYEKVSFGPVTAIVMDTSCMYSDSLSTSNGLTAFDNLRVKQTQWLDGESYGTAQYKVVISHSPKLYNLVETNYSRKLNTLGADLAICAHTGKSEYLPVGTRAQNYNTVINGSYYGDGTVATRYEFYNGVITVSTLGTNGTLKASTSITVNENDTTVYRDVPVNTWFSPAVSYAGVQHLMKGTEEGVFEPETGLTRAMAVTVLARLSCEDIPTDTDLVADVDADSWYADGVRWAYANGVTLGTSDTTFSPDALMTREQLCTMLFRMFKNKLEERGETTYSDAHEISTYATEAVNALTAAGIVNGIGDNRFAPKTVVSRAMLAQMLYKADF